MNALRQKPRVERPRRTSRLTAPGGERKGLASGGDAFAGCGLRRNFLGGNLHSEFMNREDRLRARTLAKG